MKKRLLKILAACAALLLIAALLNILNAFNGNPVSAAIASSRIKAYVRETYPGRDFSITKAGYNFKDSNYYCTVKSNTSMDTHFQISIRNHKINDSYQYDVISKWNTMQRLSTEFNNTIKDIISQDFPYQTSIVIGDFAKPETADMQQLTLDMPYDPHNLPLNTSISVYTQSDELTYEELAKRLVKLQSIIKAHDITADFYSLILEEPKKEGEPSNCLYLYEFPSEKIATDDLITAIKTHQADWEKQNEK